MTVKEFYEFMKKIGAENYKMVNYFWEGKGDFEINDWEVDEINEEIYTQFEC